MGDGAAAVYGFADRVAHVHPTVPGWIGSIRHIAPEAAVLQRPGAEGGSDTWTTGRVWRREERRSQDIREESAQQGKVET